MRAARRAAVLALLALLLAACSGDDGGEETTAAPPPANAPGATAPQPAPPPPPADGGVADEEPGEVLLRFVRAAEKGDAETMWGLLTEPTQASIGPTLSDFRADAANTFQAGLGSIAPTAKVILSRKLDEDWAVAAVAGEQTVDDETDYYAYGAALLPENGKLKLELGGVVITGYKPAPTAEIDETQPTIAANVGAGGDLKDVRMWLDGEPFPAERGANDTPFTATLSGEPAEPLAPGRHEVVVFAATEETATASAWAFTVEE